MRLNKHVMLVAVAALLLAAGCDDETVKPAVTPGAPDGGTVDVGGPGAVDTAVPGPALIPITDWVHDLVKSFGPMSPPDTVDDKHLQDTDDPGAFDSLLQ